MSEERLECSWMAQKTFWIHGVRYIFMACVANAPLYEVYTFFHFAIHIWQRQSCNVAHGKNKKRENPNFLRKIRRQSNNSPLVKWKKEYTRKYDEVIALIIVRAPPTLFPINCGSNSKTFWLRAGDRLAERRLLLLLKQCHDLSF